MRIGVFGGSFDPVHYGHLILAEQCREQANLDLVLFIPTKISPLKNGASVADDKQRVEMLSLAIAGHNSFQIATNEIDRGGKSFTVETLSELRPEFPDDEFFLLIGQDSLNSFARWREPKQICKMAIPLVVGRPSLENNGTGSVDLSSLSDMMSADRFAIAQENTITSRLIDISSTDIRGRVAADRSIRYLLPRAVEKFIETSKLYKLDE